MDSTEAVTAAVESGASIVDRSVDQSVTIGDRKIDGSAVGEDARFPDDAVEVDRRFGVAADPRVVADRDVDGAAGLLVQEDRADEVGDGDVGADSQLREIVRGVAGRLRGVLDRLANIVVRDAGDEPVFDRERERVRPSSSNPWGIIVPSTTKVPSAVSGLMNTSPAGRFDISPGSWTMPVSASHSRSPTPNVMSVPASVVTRTSSAPATCSRTASQWAAIDS